MKYFNKLHANKLFECRFNSGRPVNQNKILIFRNK